MNIDNNINDCEEFYQSIITLMKHKDKFFVNSKNFIDYLFDEKKFKNVDFNNFFSLIESLEKTSSKIYSEINKNKEKYIPNYSFDFDTYEDFLKYFPMGKQNIFSVKPNLCKESITYKKETVLINKRRYYSCYKCGIFKPKWDFFMSYDKNNKNRTPNLFSNACLCCKKVKGITKYANSQMMDNSVISYNVDKISKLEKKLYDIDDSRELEKELNRIKDKTYKDILKMSHDYRKQQREVFNKIDEKESVIREIYAPIREDNAKKREMDKLYEKFPLISKDEGDVFIYLIHYKKLNCYKIGISNNPVKRITQFKNNFNIDINDCELIEVRKPICGRAIEIEKNYIHKELNQLNVKKKYPHLGVEWFDGNNKEKILEVYYKYTINSNSD